MRQVLPYIVVFISFSINAQVFPFKNFTTTDGLIDQHVKVVIEDDRGLVWIGTPFGVNWFDGKHFYQPEIKTTTGQLYITNFYKDSNGDIWLLSFYNGLYRFSNGMFINYLPDSINLASIKNNIVGMVQYNAKEFVIATDGDLLWFDEKQFSAFDLNNILLTKHINSILKLNDGSLLMGTENGNPFKNQINILYPHKDHFIIFVLS